MKQQGATLLITLIMLLMLTLFAIGAMNTSTNNLRMIGNMQQRAEALDATQRSIETAISTPQFTATPANAIPNPCEGNANTICTDLNGDGVAELVTTLTPIPACVQARAIKVAELSITSPSSEDVSCLQAQAQGTFGVAGAATAGNSLCATTVWNITANTIPKGATAATSDLSYTLTQGIGVRVKEVDMAANCP